MTNLKFEAEETEYWYNQGIKDYESNDYNSALNCFLKVVKLDSNCSHAWNKIGYVFYSKPEPNYEKALDAFDMALEINKKDPYAWYYKGLIFLDKGEDEDALEAFEQCITLDPNNADAWVMKGRVNLYLNQYDDAIKEFDKALQIDNGNLSAINYKAYAFSMKSDLENEKKFAERALLMCEKQIEKESESFDAWYQKGFSLLSLYRYAEALKAFEKATRLKSNSFKAWNNKGNALYFLERYEDAINAYNEAYHLKPIITIQSNIGCSLSKLERCEEAIDIYDHVLERKPNFVEALNNKGFDLYKLKKYKEALEEINKAIKFNEYYAEALINKALIFQELQKPEDALEFCKKAYTLKQTSDICFNIGLILKELESSKEAKKYLKQSLSLFEDSITKNENSFEAWYKKGLVLFNLQRYEESLIAYDKAIKINNKNALIFIYKGNSYFSLGNYKEAIESYFKSINLHLKEKEIIENLDHVLIGFDHISENHYNKSIELYNKAIKSCNEVIESCLENIKYKNIKGNNDTLERAFICLGNVFLALKSYEQAIYYYEKTINLNKNSTEAWNNKGLAYYYLGQMYENTLETFDEAEKSFDEAEKAFNKAIEINPKNAMAYNNRALTFIKTGQYEKGEKDLKTSVTINPNCISANFNLSQFLFVLGNVKDAYKYISKVTQKDLSNNPNKVEAWRLQGQIETELCKYDDAINSFNEAIYQGGYDSALNSFNEAIFQGRNYYFLLWITYIKYLKAEYNFEKNSAKQNELLHSIIRDLNKSLYSLEKDRSLLKKKNRKKNTSGMESHEIDYISNTMIEIYCTLGCIYYKMEDYYTAKNKLLECVCLCKEVNKGKNSYDIEVIKRKKIEETATELVLKIWDFNIKPIWWRWWLDYPIGSKNKQIFRFLSGLLFILLFFHPLYPVLLGRLSAFIQSANSSVDWLLYIILVTILIFIILSPCLNRIKIKEVEIEISSPPSLKFEYSPVSYFEQMGDMLQKKEGLNNI